MDLLVPPAILDDPVDTLLAFHRRIERHLATLGALPSTIAMQGLDASTAARAATVLAFFSTTLPSHHEKEERYLLPLIAERLRSPGERALFADTRMALEGDHRAIDHAWRALRRPLQALAEGIERPVPEEAIHFLRALYSVHIPAEEAAFHRLAARCLGPRDRELLARRIGAR